MPSSSKPLPTPSLPPLPPQTSTNNESLYRNALAGCCAGALAKSLVAPIERVKLLMQLQSTMHNPAYMKMTETAKVQPPIPYINAFDAAKRVYLEQGILSFWRGNLPNIYRHTGATALTFALKDKFREFLFPLAYSMGDKYQFRRRKNFMASFLSGGAAGFLCTCLFYPLEFMRTRLALDTGGKVNR